MNIQSLQPKHRAIALLLVQAAFVLSVAGKYLYERKTCPRIWVRAAQYDPNTPLRGRYLGLNLEVNACSLPHDQNHELSFGIQQPPSWRWNVRVVEQDGKLVPIDAGYSAGPAQTVTLTQWANHSCDHAQVSDPVDYYIPDTAKSPFPLQEGQVLWVEVTVPPQGPPRPIQLALSDNGNWTPLNL